jgi:hypothetical protein
VDFEKDWIFRLSLSTLAMTGEVQRLQEQNGNVVLLNICLVWTLPGRKSVEGELVRRRLRISRFRD